MREQMTAPLRSALDHAQSEARALNQDFVGTEHLLLGLLQPPAPQVAHSLSAVKLDAPRLAGTLRDALPKSAEEPVVVGQLPLSPKAQRSIHTALSHAQQLHEPKVSTRLLFLALIEDGQSAIGSALASSGTDVAALKAALRRAPSQVES